MKNLPLDQYKKQLRTEILARRRAMPAALAAEYSREILSRITAFPEYQTAKTVMLYMDYQNEAAVSPLIELLWQAGKTPVIPLTTKDFAIRAYQLPFRDEFSGLNSDRLTARLSELDLLQSSAMGIREPNPSACPLCAPAQIDFIIVPGVAFDRRGNRLGFGKGCYDRFLPQLRDDVVKVAAAYSFQLCDSVPAHAADVPMDYIVTERETIVPVQDS